MVCVRRFRNWLRSSRLFALVLPFVVALSWTNTTSANYSLATDYRFVFEVRGLELDMIAAHLAKNSNAFERLNKWRKKVRVFVHVDSQDESPKQIGQTLDRILKLVRPLTRLDIKVVDEIDMANLIILVERQDVFAEPAYAKAITTFRGIQREEMRLFKLGTYITVTRRDREQFLRSHSFPSSVRESSNHYCEGRFKTDHRKSEIIAGFIRIRRHELIDLRDTFRCLENRIVEVLGMPTWAADRYAITNLVPHSARLKLLYDPSIKPGLTYDDAEKQYLNVLKILQDDYKKMKNKQKTRQ